MAGSVLPLEVFGAAEPESQAWQGKGTASDQVSIDGTRTSGRGILNSDKSSCTSQLGGHRADLNRVIPINGRYDVPADVALDG